MLDVRFLDEKESRIQRAFDGLSNITIPCERDSTMKEWMALVKKRFYPCIREKMIPVFQSNGNFIRLEENATIYDVKQTSKGKRKHHGFYVKVLSCEYKS